MSFTKKLDSLTTKLPSRNRKLRIIKQKLMKYLKRKANLNGYANKLKWKLKKIKQLILKKLPGQISLYNIDDILNINLNFIKILI